MSDWWMCLQKVAPPMNKCLSFLWLVIKCFSELAELYRRGMHFGFIITNIKFSNT